MEKEEGMLLADGPMGFVVCFEEGGTIKYVFGESLSTAKNSTKSSLY